MHIGESRPFENQRGFVTAQRNLAESDDRPVAIDFADPAAQCAERNVDRAVNPHLFALFGRADIQQRERLSAFKLGQHLGGRDAVHAAFDFVAQDVGRGDEVVDRRGEGRGVHQIGVGQLVNRHPGGQCHRGDVDPPLRVAGAGGLRTEQLAGRPVGDQFKKQRLGARHKMRFIRRGSQTGDCIEAGIAGLFLAESGAGNAVVKDLADGAAENAREGIFYAADGVGCDAALFISGRAERHIGRFAGDEVFLFGAVADGVDIRVRGLHLFIDRNGAGRTDIQSGILCEPG